MKQCWTSSSLKVNQNFRVWIIPPALQLLIDKAPFKQPFSVQSSATNHSAKTWKFLRHFLSKWCQLTEPLGNSGDKNRPVAQCSKFPTPATTQSAAKKSKLCSNQILAWRCHGYEPHDHACWKIRPFVNNGTVKVIRWDMQWSFKQRHHPREIMNVRTHDINFEKFYHPPCGHCAFFTLGLVRNYQTPLLDTLSIFQNLLPSWRGGSMKKQLRWLFISTGWANHDFSFGRNSSRQIIELDGTVKQRPVRQSIATAALYGPDFEWPKPEVLWLSDRQSFHTFQLETTVGILVANCC